MKLWTFQSISILEYFKTHDTYRTDQSKSKFLYDYLQGQCCYEWMKHQLEKFAGPCPFPERTLIWAWFAKDGRHKKPNLNKEENMGADSVLLELSVPDNLVLLSDFIDWHIPLNNGYVPFTQDDDAMDLELDWFDEIPSGEEKEKIKFESWKRILLPDQSLSNIPNYPNIQAVFWELKREYIQQIYHLRPTKKDRKKLPYQPNFKEYTISMSKNQSDKINLKKERKNEQ